MQRYSPFPTKSPRRSWIAAIDGINGLLLNPKPEIAEPRSGSGANACAALSAHTRSTERPEVSSETATQMFYNKTCNQAQATETKRIGSASAEAFFHK